MKGKDVPIRVFDEFVREFCDSGRTLDAAYGEKPCKIAMLRDGAGALGVWESDGHAACYLWSAVPSQGNHVACLLEIEGGSYKTNVSEGGKGYGMRDNVFVRLQMPCDNAPLIDLAMRMLHVTRYFMGSLDPSLRWESDIETACA
jgi:hypothetical protein